MVCPAWTISYSIIIGKSDVRTKPSGLFIFLSLPGDEEGQDQARAADDLERLVADLDGNDMSRRTAAWQQLRNAKDPKAIPLLRDAIADGDWLTQLYGAVLISEQGSEAGKAALRSATASGP